MFNKNNELRLGNGFFEPIFGNVFDTPFFIKDLSKENVMKTDVVENEGSFNLSVELPGFKKEEISLSLENGYLTISAKRENEEKKEDGKKYIRKERFTKSISRSFYLGEEVSENDISAKLEGGVLEIVIPKKEEKLPEKKTIEIE